MTKMSAGEKELAKDACRRLSGYKRREYQASIALKYFDGSAREMGWGRKGVETGLEEARTGMRCIDNFKGRKPPTTT